MNAPLPFPRRKPGELIGHDRYAEYERRKQAWIDADSQNPMVTPGTYEAAMRRIAKECGI